jgi:hypothetical protein
MIKFKDYMLEMAKVNTNINRNYEAMSSEPEWNERKDRATIIKNIGPEKLWQLIAKNDNILYILTDENDDYIADIEVDSSNNETVAGKHGIWIDAGYSKVRGGYAKLINALLKYTNSKFIMSDISLSDRAAKFWSKYVDAIENSSYKKVLYNSTTEELIPYNRNRAFSYNDNDISNVPWHIGLIK